MYQPTALPSTKDSGEILQWVNMELLRIAGILQGVEAGMILKLQTSAPDKPRERQLVFADGTSWNPGSGKGVYVYYSSAWHFLG